MCIVGEEEVGAEVFFNMGGGELGRQHWEMWMQLSQRDGVNGAV